VECGRANADEKYAIVGPGDATRILKFARKVNAEQSDQAQRKRRDRVPKLSDHWVLDVIGLTPALAIQIKEAGNWKI
jgi:hypothetical protein